jgi:hypothetical protein
MDIVERLMCYKQTDVDDFELINPDGPEAADEIERLREDKNIYAETIYELEKDVRVKNDEIERLREALKDIDGQMRQADRYLLKESTLAALQQKDSE